MNVNMTINSAELALYAFKEYIITNKGGMINYFGDIRGERIIASYYSYTLNDIKLMKINNELDAWVLNGLLAGYFFFFYFAFSDMRVVFFFKAKCRKIKCFPEYFHGLTSDIVARICIFIPGVSEADD
jgi:hypothetical protein